MVFIEPVDCVLNKLWELGTAGNFTIKDLMNACKDVPKMTFYHKLEKWTSLGIVERVERRPGRSAFSQYRLDAAKFQEVFGKVLPREAKFKL